jgi:Protein of unknown function (DUF1501)
MTGNPGPWAPYEPTPDDPWGLRKVAHLHRRAGFGATWAELHRDLKLGPAASADRLLDSPEPDADERAILSGLRDGVLDLEQVRRRLGIPEGRGAREQRAALDAVIRRAPEDRTGPLEFIQRTSLAAFASSARLEDVLRQGGGARAAYPEFGLAQRLRLIAQLIQAGLTTSVYYTQLGGFDTHLNQLGTHPALLQELGDSLRAFWEDLGRAREAERVLVLVFSEFGRRLAENASGGIDHGTAAPVFLLGPAVRTGLHGPYPDLRDLDDGDLKFALDFRRVYATLLDRWLACPSDQVLGGKFGHLPLLTERQGADRLLPVRFIPSGGLV